MGGYDSVGRVTSLNHTTPGNSIGTVVTTGYTYDRANNVTSRSQQQYGGGTYGGTWLLDGTYSTGYDDANRILTYLPNGGFQGSYTYDVTGNQTQSVTPVGAHSYSYDGAARLTRADAATMGNDNNGNRVTSDITWEDESGSYTKPVTRQTWDDAGRMASFSRYNSAGTAITYQATYSYNGDGLRTGESGYSAGGGGSPRQFANDLGRKNPVVLLDRTANNAGTFNLWGADGLFGTVTASYNGSWYVVPAYYHHDRQGSTLALTNTSGAITAQYAYDPWGTTSSTWGASVSTQYGGEPKDASGLIYLRARYYEPGTGRFVSADPFGGTAGNPASQNAYAYAGNNPVTRSDPSGMSPDPPPLPACLDNACVHQSDIDDIIDAAKELRRQADKGAVERAAAIAYWKDHVCAGCAWDIKARYDDFAEVNREAYEMAAALGNWLFGVTGTIVGFSPEVLRFSGDVDENKKGGVHCNGGPRVWFGVGGDCVKDRQMIDSGIEYANSLGYK